ncbi:putative NBD/HSP70 family sugar kinase [Microlunatus panaciterrae]|uniref:NBD/HSP70 family sugar kinase n=1 Tax=Microlunatus panaciterrae TaxID=400768 RepID=A0ABS2RIP9_9ACTN|nr:ROK family transcriptional regulator [Microlunatus panaciterrae]MBM7798578.1 putative NBD/HSP70 family sugar kinase [Microlunatus panaciterrae]
MRDLTDGGISPRGANQVSVGDFNQTVILDAIRRSRSGISRVELAEMTGLSAQSISNIARQLLRAGLVREGSRAPVARGKPRTLLELEPTGQYAVGVHLDPAVITYVILDLTGRTVARSRRVTPARINPSVIIRRMATEIERLVTKAGIERNRIVGVGIAAPGPVDIIQGIVIDPPNLEGWHRVPLREALRETTGLPVLLDKDVTAAAAAEKWSGGESRSGNFVFFYLGTGIGAGLVINNDLVRGSSHNVGEIGHVIVDPEGPRCFCGRRGCVGETSQPRYLVQLGVAAGLLDPTIDLDDRQRVEHAFTELARMALADDGEARKIMLALVDRIAKVVEDIANLLDLDRVVFGGPHWAPLEPFFDPQRRQDLDDRFIARGIHSLSVSGTDLGEDVGAVGAASLVLDHTFSVNPSALLLGARAG